MICRKCKTELPPNAVYCHMCGTKQDVGKSTKKRGNGQGTVYKRGNTWTACATRYEGNRRITKSKGGFDKKKDAIAWLSSASFVTDKPATTFAELYAEWSKLHYPTISKKKASIYAGAYKKCAALYGKKWTDIGLRHMQAVVNAQKETFYPRRDLKVLFSLMSKYAIIAGYSDRDLTPNIKLPPKEKPHKKAFTDAEIDSLWKDYNAGNSFFWGDLAYDLYGNAVRRNHHRKARKCALGGFLPTGWNQDRCGKGRRDSACGLHKTNRKAAAR